MVCKGSLYRINWSLVLKMANLSNLWIWFINIIWWEDTYLSHQRQLHVVFHPKHLLIWLYYLYLSYNASTYLCYICLVVLWYLTWQVISALWMWRVLDMLQIGCLLTWSSCSYFSNSLSFVFCSCLLSVVWHFLILSSFL